MITPAPARRRWPAVLAWACFLLILAVGLPLFLCSPLTFDVVQYDLCARKILRGGVMYRDAWDNNLPGVVWVQAAVRASLGWRSEALRLADFGFMGLTVLMLAAHSRGGESVTAIVRTRTAAVLAVFYLFSPESYPPSLAIAGCCCLPSRPFPSGADNYCLLRRRDCPRRDSH